jgi:hypothetical protein
MFYIENKPAVESGTFTDLRVETEDRNSVCVSWNWKDSYQARLVKLIQIYYTYEGHGKPSYFPDVRSGGSTRQCASNLTADNYYQVCLRVEKWIHYNDTGPTDVGNIFSSNDLQPKIQEIVHCQFIRLSSWHMAATIGTTLGAILALITIVMLIIFTRRGRQSLLLRTSAGGTDSTNQSWGTERREGSRYTSSFRKDSAFESQFDSIAIRDEMSYYEDGNMYDASYNSGTLELPTVVMGNDSVTHSPSNAAHAMSVDKSGLSLLTSDFAKTPSLVVIQEATHSPHDSTRSQSSEKDAPNHKENINEPFHSRPSSFSSPSYPYNANTSASECLLSQNHVDSEPLSTEYDRATRKLNNFPSMSDDLIPDLALTHLQQEHQQQSDPLLTTSGSTASSNSQLLLKHLNNNINNNNDASLRENRLVVEEKTNPSQESEKGVITQLVETV